MHGLGFYSMQHKIELGFSHDLLAAGYGNLDRGK